MAESTRVWGRPTLRPERCTGCGLCVTACPCGAAQLVEGKPVFRCEQRCTGKASCAACRGGFYPCQLVCEADAIHVAFAIQDCPDRE